MEKFDKIIERLELAQDAVRILELAARQIGEPDYGPAFDGVAAEYTAAWDAAGVIWDAACREEETGNRTKAKRLWSLLVPFDDEAETRLRELL